MCLPNKRWSIDRSHAPAWERCLWALLHRVACVARLGGDVPQTLSPTPLPQAGEGSAPCGHSDALGNRNPCEGGSRTAPTAFAVFSIGWGCRYERLSRM